MIAEIIYVSNDGFAPQQAFGQLEMAVLPRTIIPIPEAYLPASRL